MLYRFFPKPKKRQSINRILEERIRQARLRFNIALFMAAICGITGFIGV